jgi:hypothetical protein
LEGTNRPKRGGSASKITWSAWHDSTGNAVRTSDNDFVPAIEKPSLFGGHIELQRIQEDDMDDKAITAVSTSLALMQIQVNALVLLLEQQSGVSVKEDFQRLISEGVQAVGVETMQGIRSRIYEGIIQQGQGEAGDGAH